MTLKELVAKLKEIAIDYGGDPELAHASADDALIEYIADEEAKAAYEEIQKWYA